MLFTNWSIVREADEDKPKEEDFEDLNPEEGDTEEDEPTDYTEGADADDETPDEDGDGDEETDEDNPTDYSKEVDETEPAETDPEADPETTDESTEETDDNSNVAENDNNKLLIGDFLDLYYSCGNLVQKIDTIEKNNLVVGQIISKVTSNLTRLESLVFDYIRFEFSKRSYPQNLLRYNQFIEAMRINIEMLEKISIFSAKQ